MGKRRFSIKEIEELLKNKNVTRCSEKSITYAKEFKVNAIDQYQKQGMGSREIFKNAGFDLEIIGKANPTSCLKKWKKIYKVKGPNGLLETRGVKRGRRKIRDHTDKDKIKRLEHEVAYLKAENDFLAKLRAKRRE